MLGIIYHEGSPTVLYNIISKTSKSGLFSNERLAVLSIPEAVVGYLSKVPNLNDFQDINCVKMCKEKTSVSKQYRMISYISSSQPETLVLKWRLNEEKSWQFKFQNAEIAKLWNQYIQDILNPPPKVEQPVANNLQDLSQKENQSQKQKGIQKQQKKEQFQPKPIMNRPQLGLPPAEDSIIDSSIIAEQKVVQKETPSQPSTRFKGIEKNRAANDESFTSQIPIITTYRQKFPNNSIFASIKASGKIKIQNNSSQNLNTIWFQAIDGQQQLKRLQIYNDFLACCQKHCKAIISQLSILKSERRYIPQKENASEQTYSRDNIGINLLIEKGLQNRSELCSEYRLSDYRKVIANYSFLIKATKNKGFIKVPLACIYQFQGFTFYCQAKIPQDFFQVEPSQKLVFLPQVQRLQYQLNLKLNISYLSLYANKISTITESPNSKRRHFLILRQPKFILPLIRCRGFKNPFPVSRSYFLEASSVYPKDFDFNEQKELWIGNFFKAQNTSCTIISLQDLLQQLQKYSICYGMIIQLYFSCSNAYLKRIIASEIVSEVFYRIVRTQIMLSLKQWNTNLQKIIHNRQQPNYQGIFISLIEQLFTDYSNPRNNTWTLILNQLVDNFEINLKIDEVVPGYLLSSIALKLGINIDYQYFISQKGRLFTDKFIFSHVALISLESIFLSYSNEDLCESYEAMMDDIQSAEDETILKKLMNFFNLEENLPAEPSYWKKICKVFSLFIPFKHEGQYSHLEIYSALGLLYVDFTIYSILCSAIKWLLFQSKEVDAMINIEYFQDICWFWVSNTNPFMLNIYGILGEYYRSNSKYLQSIKYLTKYSQDQAKILSEPPKEQSAKLSEKLAKIYMSCGKHKQSLDKYREVKGYLKKGDKQPQFLRNILAKISILYLHLGDINNSLRYSKSATQLSILYPFEDEFQQFQVYSIFLRAFQITDENHKYKFYVDIIDDKFGRSVNPNIIQAILRLVIEQIIQKLTRLQTKKLGFLVYLIERRQQKNQTREELFKKLKFQVGNQRISKLLRDCMASILDVSDYVAAKQAKRPQQNPQLQKTISILEIFFKLIGFDYIVMLSKRRITTK